MHFQNELKSSEEENEKLNVKWQLSRRYKKLKNDENERLQNVLRATADENKTLKSQNASLRSSEEENRSLNQEIASLRAGKELLNHKVESLESRFQTEKAHDSVTSKVASLEAEKVTLESEVLRLQNEVSSLRAEKESLRIEKESWNKENNNPARSRKRPAPDSSQNQGNLAKKMRARVFNPLQPKKKQGETNGKKKNEKNAHKKSNKQLHAIYKKCEGVFIEWLTSKTTSHGSALSLDAARKLENDIKQNGCVASIPVHVMKNLNKAIELREKAATNFGKKADIGHRHRLDVLKRYSDIFHPIKSQKVGQRV
ncbi:hypothetical protein ACHAXN_002202 [Cyclotella atomus]